MIVNAEITAIELKKTRAGNRAVYVAFMTDCTDRGPKWKYPREFIGESAPTWVTARWWNLINQNKIWEDFFSINAFDLVGAKFTAELEEGDYGPKIKAFVDSAAQAETPAPARPPAPSRTPAPAPSQASIVPDDEIPF